MAKLQIFDDINLVKISQEQVYYYNIRNYFNRNKMKISATLFLLLVSYIPNCFTYYLDQSGKQLSKSPNGYTNHQELYQDDLGEKTKQDLIINYLTTTVTPLQPSIVNVSLQTSPIVNLPSNNNNSLSFSTTSDNYSKSNDSIKNLDNLILYHNEPELDSNKNRRENSLIVSQNDGNQLSIDNNNSNINYIFETTTTTNPVELIRSTTLNSLDEDDIMNRLYLQNSLNQNYLDESTTLPSTTLDNRTDNNNNNNNNFTVENDNKNNSNQTNIIEIMQTSESKPTSTNDSYELTNESPNFDKRKFSILNENNNTFLNSSIKLENNVTDFNDYHQNLIDSKYNNEKEKKIFLPSIESKNYHLEQQPLLTQPTLADLLYIIKHLNLANDNEPTNEKKPKQDQQEQQQQQQLNYNFNLNNNHLIRSNKKQFDLKLINQNDKIREFWHRNNNLNYNINDNNRLIKNNQANSIPKQLLQSNELTTSETSSEVVKTNNSPSIVNGNKKPEMVEQQQQQQKQKVNQNSTTITRNQIPITIKALPLAKKNISDKNSSSLTISTTQQPINKINKFSLISPYIANFDSSGGGGGSTTLKNMALDRLTHLVDLSADKLNTLANSRKLYEKLKQHYQENTRPFLIGDVETRRGFNQQVYFSADDGVKKNELNNNFVENKLKKVKSHLVTSNKKNNMDYNIDDETSRRPEGENHLDNRRIKDDKDKLSSTNHYLSNKQHSNNSKKRSGSSSSSDVKDDYSNNNGDVDSDNSYNNNNNPRNKGKRESHQVRYNSNSNANNLDNNNNNIVQNDINVDKSTNKSTSSGQMSIKTSANQIHQNDIQKNNNYYNIEEKFPTMFANNNLMDNFSNSISYQYLDENNNNNQFDNGIESLISKKPFQYFQDNNNPTFDDFPGPLTIGDLASHHGVPFRLKYPFEDNDNNHLINSVTNTDNLFNESPRLPLESNQNDNYIYMPYNNPTQIINGGSNNVNKINNNLQEILSTGLLSGNQSNSSNNEKFLKFDEELKKKLAIKTIEAIAQYPELSKTIINNLYNTLNSQTNNDFNNNWSLLKQQQQQQQQQLSPNWQKIYSNLLNSNLNTNGGGNYFHNNHPLAQSINSGNSISTATLTAPTTSSLPTNPLPVILPLPTNHLTLPELSSSSSSSSNNNINSFLTNPYFNDHIISASTTKLTNSTPMLNNQQNHQSQKWALSKMPDLIPIPLAATVPGYLIRLPNGQILAAALTNSFSIQGIQKGPLSSGYKKFLNQRFKNLMIKQNYNFNNKPNTISIGGSPINYMTSDSGISAIAITPNTKLKTNGDKNNSPGGGIFSRGVLSQLGFNRSIQKMNNNSTQSNNRENNKSKSSIKNHKLIKLTGSDSLQTSSISEQDLASLPLADFSEPVFSFADESQLVESNPELPTNSNVISSINNNNAGIGAGNLIGPDSAEMFQNDNSLALRAKLNQLLSIRNFFNEDVFHSTSSKRRRSPPSMQTNEFVFNHPVVSKCKATVEDKPPIFQRLLSKLSYVNNNKYTL